MTPDSRVRSAIERLMAAHSEAETGAPLAELRAVAGDDLAVLVPQLALYATTATDVREGMAAAVIADRLGLGPDEILRGAAPYLDTPDLRLRRELWNMMSAVDGAEPGRPPDFSRYAAYLKAHREPPPDGLMFYMIELDPDLGFATVVAALIPSETDRATLLTKQVPPGEFAEDRRWWVRLYAVELLRHQGGKDEISARLRSDSHPLVREAASTLH